MATAETQALENEECRQDGTGACDMAKKNVLVCTGGHYKTQLHCAGPIGCELPGNYSVRCDKSIVVEREKRAPKRARSRARPTASRSKCTDSTSSAIGNKTWKPKKGETCANRYRVSFETEKFEAR